MSDDEKPIEGLKGIAAFLSQHLGHAVTTQQVWVWVHRSDGIPAKKPMGRWFAKPHELRQWAASRR